MILVHGIFSCNETLASDIAAREKAIAEHGKALGVCGYEWISGRGKKLANRLLQRVRGTAPAVDAVEIIELNESAVRASLANDSTRRHWQEALSCASYGIDTARSFILIGTPLQQVEGPPKGQRLFWFGRGLSELTEAEFIEHYTGHHGPLVAGSAQALGLRRYRQIPSEQSDLCESLREVGMGQAIAPSVFAELFMGAPPLKPASLRIRRIANREIAKDEKRHIDFSQSMLLLV
ncbi:MAG: EthD domain-containing protein [Halioglobus sp.]